MTQINGKVIHSSRAQAVVYSKTCPGPCVRQGTCTYCSAPFFLHGLRTRRPLEELSNFLSCVVSCHCVPRADSPFLLFSPRHRVQLRPLGGWWCRRAGIAPQGHKGKPAPTPGTVTTTFSKQVRHVPPADKRCGRNLWKTDLVSTTPSTRGSRNWFTRRHTAVSYCCRARGQGPDTPPPPRPVQFTRTKEHCTWIPSPFVTVSDGPGPSARLEQRTGTNHKTTPPLRCTPFPPPPPSHCCPNCLLPILLQRFSNYPHLLIDRFFNRHRQPVAGWKNGTGGGGDISRGNISLWEISYFKCVRNQPTHQAMVQNQPGAKFSHWGAFSLPLCSLAFELLSVGRGWRRPRNPDSPAGGCLYAHSPRGRPREGERLRGLKDQGQGSRNPR